MVRYRLPYFPERDYTFSAWVCPEALPTDGLYQIVSAWAAGMDDPIRICIQGADLFARIEARAGFSSRGVPLEGGRWVHIAAVKAGTKLSLYVNGELKQTADVPEWNATGARDLALGANPHWRGGPEYLLGKLDDYRFYAQALAAEQIGELAHR
jgi:hypothetical protein